MMPSSSPVRKRSSRTDTVEVDRIDLASDVYHLKKVFDSCSKAARIGAWECSLADERLWWTDMVYELFDVDPGTPLVRDEIVTMYSAETLSELKRLRSAAIEQLGSFSLDAEVITRKGNRRWIRITARVESENGKAVRIFGLKQDVTLEIMMLKEIRHRADFDHLTGLANRFRFHERLDSLVGSALATDCALLLVDLDGFKRVNDSLGHRVGDSCLIEAARRLNFAAEGADLVSRIGGDEFAVIYRSASIQQVETAANRIVAAMQWNAGDDIALGASIGVAWAGSGSTSASLYEEADRAMYRAKASGRNRFVVHQPPSLDAA
jgi:diguanylate cyclase (GGDEF)-like protein